MVKTTKTTDGQKIPHYNHYIPLILDQVLVDWWWALALFGITEVLNFWGSAAGGANWFFLFCSVTLLCLSLKQMDVFFFFARQVWDLYIWVAFILCVVSGFSAFFELLTHAKDRHSIAKAIIFSIAWPVIGTAYIIKEVKKILSN